MARQASLLQVLSLSLLCGLLQYMQFNSSYLHYHEGAVIQRFTFEDQKRQLHLGWIRMGELHFVGVSFDNSNVTLFILTR